MIARLTRLMILLQVLILVALSTLVSSLASTASLLASVLAATFALMLIRVLILLNNFFLSSALRQRMGSGQRPPLLPMTGRMLQEVWHSLRCWFVLFPFARPFSVIVAGGIRPPVLLLHGYGANSGFWKPLSRQLSKAGISHGAIDLEPILGSIDDYAEPIERAAQQLCSDCNATQIMVVGHSMGGLAGRAWVRRYGCDRLAGMITLGTPHFGSTLAAYGMGVNAREMLPPVSAGDENTRWLTQLADAENNFLRARITSIYSLHDNIVSPQASAHLPGANNIAVDLVGHVALGFDSKVTELLVNEIRTSRQSRWLTGS